MNSVFVAIPALFVLVACNRESANEERVRMSLPYFGSGVSGDCTTARAAMSYFEQCYAYLQDHHIQDCPFEKPNVSHVVPNTAAMARKGITYWDEQVNENCEPGRPF